MKYILVIVMMASLPLGLEAQDAFKKKKRKPQPFRWVNPPVASTPKTVKHAAFKSPSMGVSVGYYIYLPPHYSEAPERRFPVVYYLHGGRPGSELKSVRLVNHIHPAMESGKVSSAIYVFVNGGPVSHYNMPKQKGAQGEAVFIKELIPHIDATYRTIARREGRGLEGFSQGGRGTARIMFKHPYMFVSAAPGGGGHATEKRISEEEGRESESLVFAKGDNTWDLARRYAADPKPKLNILVHVGDKGFNYQNNLEWMRHLTALKVPFEHLIIRNAPHSAQIIYEKNGLDLIRFHAGNFEQALKGKSE
jgi:endo-1,4-beta-xylanase